MANDTEDKKHFPTKEEIIEFIDMSPTPVGKREIARAFNIKGAAKIELKKILKELKKRAPDHKIQLLKQDEIHKFR